MSLSLLGVTTERDGGEEHELGVAQTGIGFHLTAQFQAVYFRHVPIDECEIEWLIRLNRFSQYRKRLCTSGCHGMHTPRAHILL